MTDRDTEKGHEGNGHGGGVRSTVHIVGHPVHPILIVFPIAFLTAAIATDIAFLATDDPFWARASLWLVGSGFLSGIVAAVPGLVDFSTIPRARIHRTGWVHLVGNVAVLSMALPNWLLRIGDLTFVEPWGLVLSLATGAVLAVSGWAGGELSYRHEIGVTGH
jgi:uncharacterized membrane protein